MTKDRLPTAIILLLGLIFYFLVMPGQVEQTGYGRILPSTVPSIAIWVLIAAAAVQLVGRSSSAAFDAVTAIRAVFFLGVMVAGVWLMDILGFEYVAPAMALIVMLSIGERRWHWLFFGAVIIPVGSWLIVERLLDRVLA